MNEYIRLTTFKFYDDGIGMANNYWSSFFDMISKNIVHMGIRPGSSAEENIPHLKLEVEFK